MFYSNETGDLNHFSKELIAKFGCLHPMRGGHKSFMGLYNTNSK